MSLKTKRCSSLFTTRLSTQMLTRWTQLGEGGGGKRFFKKNPKQLRLEYFQWGGNSKQYSRSGCVGICVSLSFFPPPEKQAAVRLQRSADPDSTFTFSLLADSSSATRSLAVCGCCCCCCHRARRTHSLRRHSAPVPDCTFKIRTPPKLRRYNRRCKNAF